MTSPILEEDSYDAHLARRLVRAAAAAVSHEECRQLGGGDPAGGDGFYAAGIVAAQAVLRTLAEATPGNEYTVDLDFDSLADLIEDYAARVADPSVYRDRRPWRVGNHYGIHIYAVNGDDGDDESIGTTHSARVARQIVAEHNVRLPGAAS
ncbi:hypothetical protein SAMN05421837_107331 [Amycolatopsis pretoriensis]|uniref:Uncharacterized protein n=1 Tax=Amycolatopsis pretoriensis TaxID=218821 RepID=A0A1H5R7G4_9PSEU|nr:hypothetical protein [Amycolatopsis pretoriensis]SEF34346.1 hypothetical protein SAMN05421837_107331 [Amycolatopsis pretoriensis]